MTASFLDDLVLEEGGIQACVARWRAVAYEALLIEFAAAVLQKTPSRVNLVVWMEAELRRQNAVAAKRAASK